MTWFGLNGILYVFFIALACISFISSQIQFYRSGLMFKFGTRERWKEALFDPERRIFVTRTYQLFAATFVCGLLALGAMSQGL